MLISKKGRDLGWCKWKVYNAPSWKDGASLDTQNLREDFYINLYRQFSNIDEQKLSSNNKVFYLQRRYRVLNACYFRCITCIGHFILDLLSNIRMKVIKTFEYFPIDRQMTDNSSDLISASAQFRTFRQTFIYCWHGACKIYAQRRRNLWWKLFSKFLYTQPYNREHLVSRSLHAHGYTFNPNFLKL